MTEGTSIGLGQVTLTGQTEAGSRVNSTVDTSAETRIT